MNPFFTDFLIALQSSPTGTPGDHLTNEQLIAMSDGTLAQEADATCNHHLDRCAECSLLLLHLMDADHTELMQLASQTTPSFIPPALAFLQSMLRTPTRIVAEEIRMWSAVLSQLEAQPANHVRGSQPPGSEAQAETDLFASISQDLAQAFAPGVSFTRNYTGQSYTLQIYRAAGQPPILRAKPAHMHSWQPFILTAEDESGQQVRLLSKTECDEFSHLALLSLAELPAHLTKLAIQFT